MFGQKFTSSLHIPAILLGVAGLVIFSSCRSADAQVVQLPTLNVFNINTAVSVPDGGTMLLGGVSGGSHGLNGRSVPGLSVVPLANRPFRNQGYGSNRFSRNASVSVTIISMREQEAEVLAGAERRQALRSREFNPNGSAETQSRAAFISRNIGRRK